MAYTHASLFSGIGGAELAASWLRWANVFHCEVQEFQRKVLEYWFPNSISYEDITKTDFTEWKGRIDVLTGGFPCQPFSVAGKRKGADDNRYLWGEMLRAIREIQPTWVVGENVAGLLSMVQPAKAVKVGRTDDLFDESYIYRTERQFTLDAICTDLEHAGYSVQPLVIPACAVGAPHRRDRIWIVAHRADAGVKGLQQGRQDGFLGFIPTSNTQRFRGDEMDNEVQPEVANGQRTDCHGLLGTSAHTDEQGRHAFRHDDAGTKEPQQAKRKLGGADCPQSWWRDFPTVAPVCNGNDGLPFGVADLAISFPQWRSKSIEALGNAWVPQVAYEIFKAIENNDKNQTK